MHGGAPIAEILLADDDPVGAFELVERVLPVNSRGPAGGRRVDGARGPGRGRPGPASIGRPRPGGHTAPSGGADPAGQDAGDPARCMPSSPPVPTTPSRSPGPLSSPPRQGRAKSVEDQVRLWRDAVAALRHSRSRLGRAGVVVATRRRAGRVGRSGTEAAELLRSVHDYADRQGAARCRPASRSWPRAPASHWPRRGCPLRRPYPPRSPG